MDEPERLQRLVPLPLKATLVAALAIGLFLATHWWRAPSSSWACDTAQPGTGCTGEVRLDVSDFAFESPMIGRRSFDLSPDGSRVVVGITNAREHYDNRYVLAEFDVDTGQLLRTIRDVAGEPGYEASTGQVVYSPDGARLAAITGTARRRQLEVVDVTTGETLATIADSNRGDRIDCDGRLGFSTDQALVQCRNSTFSALDGSFVGNLDRQISHASKDGSGIAVSTSGILADGLGSSTIEVRSEGSGDLLTTIDPGARPFDNYRTTMSFHPGNQLLIEEVLDSSDWSLWSRRGPRRSNPSAQIIAYEIDGGTAVARVEVGSRSTARGWSDDGTMATISSEFLVRTYRFDEAG